MTDFPENEKINSAEEISAETEIIADEYAEYETIFGDPKAHNDKKSANSKNGKKRMLSLVAAVLSVAILVGGTIAVINLIPEKEDEETPNAAFEDITVIDYEADKLSSVTVTNPQGTFKLLSETTASESDSSESTTKTVWCVEGMDRELLSESSLNGIVSAAAKITASRSVDTKTAADCGLDTPLYTVDVTSEEYGNYSVYVGNDSPDNSGTYLKLSTSDTIYIVATTAVADYNFALLDLASTNTLAGLTVPDSAEGYKDDSGALLKFDKLLLSGKQFPEEVEVVVNSSGDELSQYASYIVKRPTYRIADNIDAFLTLFQSGISPSGAYAFDTSSASLAAVGLDNPDMVVTMTAAGASRTYKLALQSDGNYAVVADDSRLIHKVSASSVAFAGYTTDDIYSTWVYLTSINDISNLTFTHEDEVYSFDIVYDDSEDAEETYVITHNGEKIDAENFKELYQLIVGIACSDYSIDTTLTAEPTGTLTVTYTKDGSKDTIAFTKASETKYQYTTNGVMMGKITSAAYNKVIKNLRLVSQGKAVVN